MATWHWGTYFLFIGALLLSSIFLNKLRNCKTVFIRRNLFLALLPTYLLLILRGSEVGKDLRQYDWNVTKYMNNAQLTISLMSEPFLELIYFVSSFCGGIRAFIFISATLEYLFIYLALYELRKREKRVDIIFLMFFGFVVIRSFSMVSNGIALACSLCAYVYLDGTDKESSKKFWIYTVIAIFFHISAIVNVLVYFCCRPIKSKQNLRKEVLFKIMVFFAFFCGCIMLSQGYFNAIIAGIADGQYAHFQAAGGFGLGNIIIRLPMIIVTLYTLPAIHNKCGKKVNVFVYLLILDVLVAQLKYLGQDFERFAMYTGMAVIFICSYIYKTYCNRNRGLVRIITPIALLMYITYYLYHWAVMNGSKLMPYEFLILQ